MRSGRQNFPTQNSPPQLGNNPRTCAFALRLMGAAKSATHFRLIPRVMLLSTAPLIAARSIAAGVVCSLLAGLARALGVLGEPERAAIVRESAVALARAGDTGLRRETRRSGRRAL